VQAGVALTQNITNRDIDPLALNLLALNLLAESQSLKQMMALLEISDTT